MTKARRSGTAASPAKGTKADGAAQPAAVTAPQAAAGPSSSGAGPGPSSQRQEADEPNRPTKFIWTPYNEFDRGHYEEHGTRPTLQAARQWYKDNVQAFVAAGNPVPPTWSELKVHRGRFRVDTGKTRQYTNARREKKRAQVVKEKAQRTWRKIPAVMRVLALCKSVRRSEEDLWRDFLAVFQKGKHSFKGVVLSLMAVRRMKAATEQGFVQRMLQQGPSLPLDMPMLDEAIEAAIAGEAPAAAEGDQQQQQQGCAGVGAGAAPLQA